MLNPVCLNDRRNFSFSIVSMTKSLGYYSIHSYRKRQVKGDRFVSLVTDYQRIDPSQGNDSYHLDCYFEQNIFIEINLFSFAVSLKKLSPHPDFCFTLSLFRFLIFSGNDCLTQLLFETSPCNIIISSLFGIFICNQKNERN